MKVIRIIIALIVFLALACSRSDLSDSIFVSKEEASFAKEYLNKIRIRDFEYVLKYADPELSSKISEAKLIEISQYFPSGEIQSVELIGSQVNSGNNKWQGNFSFEYKFEKGWAVANVVIRRINNKITVIGFHVYQTKESLKEQNKFNFSNKSTLHYVVLFFACIIPAFIMTTLIYCVITPIQKRKWLWVIFILGGISSVSINWVTGVIGFNLAHYLLFGASATASSEYSPWIITVGLPLGAILFWFKRKSFIDQSIANKSLKIAA